jgi:hypothetical protein
MAPEVERLLDNPLLGGTGSGLPAPYQSAQPVDPGSPMRGASESQNSSRFPICSSSESRLIAGDLRKPAL